MARHPEYQYLDILEHLIEKGDRRMDRTKVGTSSMFGAMMRFDLSDGTLPIFTTKKTYWKTAAKEMLWFLTGDTNIRSLLKQNVKIWTDWPLDKYRKASGINVTQEAFEARILADDDFAAEWGDLGPVYGKQWRKWQGADGQQYDQLANVIETLKINPASRRILFHGWNVAEVDQMALPPCHLLYQFHVANMNNPDGSRPYISMGLYQRSCDVGAGLPFNITSAGILLHMVAKVVGMNVGELIWFGGDVHLYSNHFEAARTMLSREPYPFPKFRILRDVASIDDFRIEDFEVTGYQSHPAIELPIAV